MIGVGRVVMENLDPTVSSEQVFKLAKRFRQLVVRKVKLYQLEESRLWHRRLHNLAVEDSMQGGVAGSVMITRGGRA